MLVALARRTGHPTTALDAAATTFCQCGLCVRIERALVVASADARAEAEMQRDNLRALLDEAYREPAQLSAALKAASARLASDDALVGIWHAIAVIERDDAVSVRAIAPAMRSVHNHRAIVYDLCAADLTAIRRRSP